MLKLYYLPGSCSTVPHVALEWAKAEYEAQAVDRDFIKSLKYLALNPQGAVPLLQNGAWTLTQNIAIIDYVDEKYPAAKIFGSGNAEARAKARQWLAFANTDVHKAFGFIFRPGQLIEGEAEEAHIRANAVKRVGTLLAVADQVLQTQDYLTGEITIADVYVYIILRWARSMDIAFPELTALPAYFDRVESNEGVQRVLKQQGLV